MTEAETICFKQQSKAEILQCGSCFTVLLWHMGVSEELFPWPVADCCLLSALTALILSVSLLYLMAGTEHLFGVQMLLNMFTFFIYIYI